jgi:hypothetical protein
MASWTPTPTPHNESTRAGFHVGYEIKDGEFGKGLYAVHHIPAGTLMWKYQSGPRGAPNVNVWSYTSEESARTRLGEVSKEDASYIMDHVYMFDGRLNEITDDGKLWNHSETPNTGLPPKGEEYCFESTYSIKDIQPGEQFLVRQSPAHLSLDLGAPLLSLFPLTRSASHTFAPALQQDDYGIYEYSEWYNRLCKENGVTRDFVTKKPAPTKQ